MNRRDFLKVAAASIAIAAMGLNSRCGRWVHLLRMGERVLSVPLSLVRVGPDSVSIDIYANIEVDSVQVDDRTYGLPAPYYLFQRDTITIDGLRL